MLKEYDEFIKSEVADMKNTGSPRRGHNRGRRSSSNQFVGDTPWVHLDIAGVDMDKDKGWVTKGASGYSVRALVHLAVGMGEGG